MPSLISPIVGHQFRPLSDKAALATSAPGSPLILSPEPDNKVDPNAIKVILIRDCDRCNAAGFTSPGYDEVCSECEGKRQLKYNIGYIPSSLNPNVDFTKFASNLTVLSVLSGCSDHIADLEFDLDGNPYVNLSWG